MYDDSATASSFLFMFSIFVVFALTAANMDVNVSPDEMSKANIACTNNGGLEILGKDNGEEYTAHCRDGISYEYKLPEKK